MKFLEIVKKLQNLEENEGYLVLVRELVKITCVFKKNDKIYVLNTL